MADNKGNPGGAQSATKSVEQVIVIPRNPKTGKSQDGDKGLPGSSDVIRRSSSDGDLYANFSSFTGISSLTRRTNWTALVNDLKMKQGMRKTSLEMSYIDAILKSKAKRKEGRGSRLRNLGRKLSCLFSGPMFYRHRFRIIIFLEVFIPVFIFFFVSWSFTSGISWKKAYSERKAADAIAGAHRGAEINPNPTDEALVLKKFRDKFVDRAGRAYIAYSPATAFTNTLMETVIKQLGLDISVDKVIPGNPHSSIGAAGVEDGMEVLEHCLLHRLDRVVHKNPVGIEFDLMDIDPQLEIPRKLKFVIRTFDQTIAETLDPHPYVQPPRKSTTWYPPYVESGFIGLQLAIQKAYLEIVHDKLIQRNDADTKLAMSKTSDANEVMAILTKSADRPLNPTDLPKLEFKLLFTPNYFDQSVRQLISLTICLILCFSYTGLSYFIVRQFVIEGQSGIKDYLSLHNMDKWLHWVVYCCHTLVFRTITALGITGTLFLNHGQGPILSNSNPVIVYMIMFFHLMSLSAFNFFIGTILTSVLFSGIVSVTICFFSFVFPYCLLKAGLMSNIVNLILAIMFPNWALWNAILELVDYECDEVGVNWANLRVLTNAKSQLTYAQCILIFLGGNIFYFLVAMICDLRVGIPGKIKHSSITCIQNIRKGTGKNKSKKSKKSKRVTTSPRIRAPPESDEAVEPSWPIIYERPESTRKILAKVRDLSHSYGQHKLVLDSINLDIVNSEIMVILGHADSGKSTILQCLAGILRPTLGSVTVNELDLYQDSRVARDYIGYCPQDVVLFNVLSVQEHLVLCYKLRGLATKEAKEFADGLMDLLRISDVRKYVPGAMTQDERRKLSIALCLLDKPSIILLDEPTNGMEPLTRHEIWTILKSLKSEGQTIVMTTSMMDEAEFLADRVALLAHGKLICYGTPKFLKERYDIGYYLRIVPNPAKFSLDTFQAFAIKHFDSALPEAPEKTTFDQRNFLLVLPSRKIDTYGSFFDALEAAKESLGIIDYGCQTVNLSDIFIKISEEVILDKNPAPDIYIRRSQLGTQRSTLWGEIPEAVDFPPPTKLTQFKVMLWKLWLYSVGSNSFFSWKVIIPCVLIWVTVWHSRCFVEQPPTPIQRDYLLATFPMANVYVKLEGLTKNNMDWKLNLENILGTQREELKLNERIEEVVKRDMKEDRDNLNFTIEKRMIAIQLKDKEFWAYYSSGSLHSPPLVLSILGNLFLRGVTNKFETQKDTYSMITGNSPFPNVFESEFDITCGLTCLMFGLIISFSIGFFLTLLMTFPVLERASGMKQLQFMSGLHPLTYWLAYTLYYFLLSLILTLLVAIIFLMNSESIYSSPATFGTLLLIVCLFLCWSGIPWVYYLTIVVPTSLDGILLGFIIHVGFGLIPTMILELGSNENTDFVFFKYFFHVFPPHTLTSSMSIFFDIVSKRSICKSLPNAIHKMCEMEDELRGDKSRFTIETKYIYEYMVRHDANLAKCCEKICHPTNSCSKMTPFFDPSLEGLYEPRLFTCIIAFIFQGIFYWGLLMVLESRVVSNYWHNLILKFLRNRVESKDDQEEPDIRKEKEAVNAIMEKGRCPKGTLMVCQGLTKSYTEHMIINDVNIELKEGDIVGLLGGTGCGKSVVIKMLAGEVVPTRGTVMAGNITLHQNRRDFLRRLSYCHQEDALFDTFTGNQMMELIGKLRGLGPSDIPVRVKKWLHVLGLAEAGDDKCELYSSSMRRRLCAAMALIGRNSILLLDEPTRGLDAVAKLRFWSIIRQLASQGHGVIFTSASVTECELYATKLFVVSEGNVQCIGPPAQLRHRFSKGFTFLIRLRFEVLTPLEIVSTTIGRIDDLKKTVEKKYKRAILRDEQGNLLLYFLTGSSLTWGKLFAMAEEIQGEHEDIVESYDISQATLDDVFVLLTNRYTDMDLPRNMRSSFPGEITQEEAEVQAFADASKKTNLLDD